MSPPELGARPDPGSDPVRIDLGSLSITVWCPTPEHRTVLLAGDVDMVNVSDLRACVLEQLETNPRSLVLDFSDVTFFGSAGLALLIEARNLADKLGTTLHLTNITHDVARLLDITGLVDMFKTDNPPPEPELQ